MSHYISEDQAKHWSSIASKLRQVSELIGECRLILILQLDVLDGKPMQVIDAVDSALSGGAYMFTPQTEWTGGDSSDPKNFKPTLPHIAR